MKCPNCNEELEKGYLKSMKGFVYFQKEEDENNNLKNLTFPFIYGYKCPKCNKIELNLE